MSTFEVHVTDNFMVDGLSVYISLKHSAMERTLMRVSDHGSSRFEAIEPMMQTDPTFTIPGEAGRALLDALIRHYQGGGDLHALRQDYDAERRRVDKLTDAVITIASGARHAAH